MPDKKKPLTAESFIDDTDEHIKELLEAMGEAVSRYFTAHPDEYERFLERPYAVSGE